MIIVSFVKKEMVVGIMIVHRLLFMEDMEMGNLFSLINEGSLKLGSTTVKLNGNKRWLFGVTDSTKHYGCFSKGSNPLGATNKASW